MPDNEPAAVSTHTDIQARAERVATAHTNMGDACENCKHRFPYDECVACGENWPCETSALCEDISVLLAENAEKDAEIARLRAAIDEIDHHTYGWSMNDAFHIIERIRLTARSALGGGCGVMVADDC